MKINDLLNNNKNINKNIKLLALSKILDLDVNNLLLCEKDLSKKDIKKYNKIITKVEKNKSIQYILKESYFYDDSYYVDKNVLIPRPETENLIIETEKLIKKLYKENNISILDIGTGSGIIAITMKKLNPKSNVIATDISKKALKVAKYNAKTKNIDINFIKTNIMDDINTKIDVIISNPPYIDIDDPNIEPIVKENEPKLALFAEDKGLYFYKEILTKSKHILNKRNIIAFEIGYNLKDRIIKIVKQTYPQAKIITKKDYNNYDRYIFIINE